MKPFRYLHVSIFLIIGIGSLFSQVPSVVSPSQITEILKAYDQIEQEEEAIRVRLDEITLKKNGPSQRVIADADTSVQEPIPDPLPEATGDNYELLIKISKNPALISPHREEVFYRLGKIESEGTLENDYRLMSQHWSQCVKKYTNDVCAVLIKKLESLSGDEQAPLAKAIIDHPALWQSLVEFVKGKPTEKIVAQSLENFAQPGMEGNVYYVSLLIRLLREGGALSEGANAALVKLLGEENYAASKPLLSVSAEQLPAAIKKEVQGAAADEANVLRTFKILLNAPDDKSRQCAAEGILQLSGVSESLASEIAAAFLPKNDYVKMQLLSAATRVEIPSEVVKKSIYESFKLESPSMKIAVINSVTQGPLASLPETEALLTEAQADKEEKVQVEAGLVKSFRKFQSDSAMEEKKEFLSAINNAIDARHTRWPEYFIFSQRNVKESTHKATVSFFLSHLSLLKRILVSPAFLNESNRTFAAAWTRSLLGFAVEGNPKAWASLLTNLSLPRNEEQFKSLTECVVFPSGANISSDGLLQIYKSGNSDASLLEKLKVDGGSPTIPQINALMIASASPDKSKRLLAVRLLARLCDVSVEAADFIGVILSGNDTKLQLAAVSNLASGSHQRAEIWKKLTQFSAHQDEALRQVVVAPVIMAVSANHPGAAEIAKKLEEDQSSNVRAEVYYQTALLNYSGGKKSGDYASMIEQLVKSAKNGSKQAMKFGYKTIAEMPEADQTKWIHLFPGDLVVFVGLLDAMSETPSEPVKAWINRLGAFLEPAKKGEWEALAILLHAAKNKHPMVIEVVNSSLSQLYPPEQVKAAIRIAQNKMGEVAEEARQGKMDSLQALKIITQDQDADLRRQAYTWIGSLAGVNDAALALVTELANSSSPVTRQGAVMSLGTVAVRRPEMLKLTIAALKDKEPSVRSAAINSLFTSVLRNHTEATEALIQAAETDPIDALKVSAIQCLANASTAGNSRAVSAVKQMASHQNPIIAKTAAEAMKRYGL